MGRCIALEVVVLGGLFFNGLEREGFGDGFWGVELGSGWVFWGDMFYKFSFGWELCRGLEGRKGDFGEKI